MVMYLATKGEARDVLDQLEVEEMTSIGGLARMWALLEEAFGQPEDDEFELAEENFHNYRRTNGTSMAKYLTTLKRLQLEYLKEDPGSVISEKAWAQRMLNRAGLAKRERHDVWYSAGGSYDPARIEEVLRRRCAHVHQDDMRRGPPSTRLKRRGAKSPHRSRARSLELTTKRRGRPYRRPYSVHYADEDEEIQAAEQAGLAEQNRILKEYYDACEASDGEESDANCDNEDLEQELQAEEEEIQEAYHTGDESASQNSDSENSVTSEDESEEGLDLRAAWAAGWRAKGKTAEQKKACGFSKGRQPSRGGSKGPKRKTSKGRASSKERSQSQGSTGAIDPR